MKKLHTFSGSERVVGGQNRAYDILNQVFHLYHVPPTSKLVAKIALP